MSGTFLVQLFTGNQLAMFLAPCAIGGSFVLLFAAMPEDRRLPGGQTDVVATGTGQRVLRRPAEEPGLRLGLDEVGSADP